jgi:MFS family permease
MPTLFSPFAALCTVGFFARLSYALARSPVLPLFALYLGSGPEAIGFAVGISTVTGIFFKLPAGALSDIIGRKRTMLIGLVVFAIMPFTYLLVRDYRMLVAIRFTALPPQSTVGLMAVATSRERKAKCFSVFLHTIIGNPWCP